MFFFLRGCSLCSLENSTGRGELCFCFLNGIRVSVPPAAPVRTAKGENTATDLRMESTRMCVERADAQGPGATSAGDESWAPQRQLSKRPLFGSAVGTGREVSPVGRGLRQFLGTGARERRPQVQPHAWDGGRWNRRGL